ncbi:MAG: energy transducer TonB [Saprospiraceae bacterium]
MDLALTSDSLMGIFAALLIGIIAFIFGMRYLYGNKDSEELSTAFNESTRKSPLEGRSKYPEVDAFGLSGTFFNVGLLVALGITILAFSWTTYEKVIDVSQYMDDLEEEIEVEPPRTAEPPPPPPPPPPPVIEEVPEEEIEEEDEIEFEDTSIEVEDVIETPPPVVEEKKAPPPPPPPPPEPEVEEIFTVVEEMPRFPGCEDKTDKAERKKCATEKMLQFIYKNIKYPPIARENGVEGTTVIRFYVDKDGTVKSPEILKDIGAGCGTEAKRVVQMMNKMGQKWIPGKQRGKAVKVYFNLPVRFRLE